MTAPPNPRLFTQTIGGERVSTEITLRDLFAAAALQGIISAGSVPPDPSHWAYGMADLMLAERIRDPSHD